LNISCCSLLITTSGVGLLDRRTAAGRIDETEPDRTHDRHGYEAGDQFVLENEGKHII
jgi:hypothetical protein